MTTTPITITITAADLRLLRGAILDKIERLQDEQRSPSCGIAAFAEAAAEAEAELQALNAVLRDYAAV